VIESIRKVTDLPLDVHLMIENADRYIKSFVEAGADILTVQVEACRHLNRTIQIIKEQEVRAGAVLNPATPLSNLEEVLHELDMVLLMTVNPGFGGQSFIPSMLGKISNLNDIMSNYEDEIELQVDGGVKPENAKEIKESGASVLVAGSAIFNSKDYKKAIKNLREA
jgi:ribulose-phosphate 3-epimerase